jgi:hypothetical protein
MPGVCNVKIVGCLCSDILFIRVFEEPVLPFSFYRSVTLSMTHCTDEIGNEKWLHWIQSLIKRDSCCLEEMKSIGWLKWTA